MPKTKLTTSSSTPTTSFNVNVLITGDTNGDGIVNMKDAAILAPNWRKKDS